MTIDTKLLKMKTWFTIEAWARERRKYIILSVGDVWRYETAEARDAVLDALTLPNEALCESAREKGKP